MQYIKDYFFSDNIRNCQVNERFYGIPIVGGAQLLFYRKDLFESLELLNEYQRQYQLSLRPPRTWKEFNNIAEFFTRRFNSSSPTEYGTSLSGAVDEELAPEILIRLWSFGGKLWDSYNRPTFDTKENHAAFESVLQTLEYIPGDIFHTSIKKTVEEFCSGQTAMLVTYSEYAQKISQGLKNNAIGRVGYYTIPGNHPASVGWNIGVNPFTKQQEEAYQLLNWLCQQDTGFYLTILYGATSMIAPHHNHELRKLYPWLSYAEKSISKVTKRNGPYKKNALVIPQNKIEQILCQELKNILIRKFTIQDAMKDGQICIDQLFKSYGYPTIHKPC